MAEERVTVDYICPLMRETCINSKPAKENPFTGTPMVEQCAWGTSDGRCAVALLMQAAYTSTTRGGY